MILISVILSCIKPIPRHYYILPLNYCKTIFAMLFFQGRGDVAPYMQISIREEICVCCGKPKQGPHKKKK